MIIICNHNHSSIGPRSAQCYFSQTPLPAFKAKNANRMISFSDLLYPSGAVYACQKSLRSCMAEYRDIDIDTPVPDWPNLVDLT